MSYEVGVKRDGPTHLTVYGGDQVRVPAEKVLFRVATRGERLSYLDEFCVGDARGQHAQVRVAKVVEELVAFFALRWQYDGMDEFAVFEASVKVNGVAASQLPKVAYPIWIAEFEWVAERVE